MSSALYGILAQFSTPGELLHAIRALREKSVADIEAYTPYPVEGLSEALGIRRNCVPLVTLMGGLVGGLGGYFMQWYAAVISFPINVGGRPLNSWPLFVPVTFELTILCAALAAVFGMLIANGLPRLRHPLFDAPDFNLATQDRYFICIPACSDGFDTARIKRLLGELGPMSIIEVAQ